MKTERGELVFLVRMWQQHGENPDAPEWRGSVLETGSGLRFYVSAARDVADFISARLAESAKPAPEKPG